MAMTHNGAAIERTARRAAADAKSAVRRGSRAVSNAADDAADAAVGGFSGVLEMLEDKLGWTGSRISALGDRIQERPLQSAAIAAGVGAAIGYLFWRR